MLSFVVPWNHPEEDDLRAHVISTPLRYYLRKFSIP